MEIKFPFSYINKNTGVKKAPKYKWNARQLRSCVASEKHLRAAEARSELVTRAGAPASRTVSAGERHQLPAARQRKRVKKWTDAS